MRRWSLSVTGLLCLVAMLSAVPAMAQNATVSTNPPAYGQGSNSQSMTPSGGLRTQPQDGAGNDVSAAHPLPVQGVSGGSPISTIPPKLTAYGTLAVTSSSVALSTLTVGPNSPAWTTAYPSNYVSIRNSVGSTGTVYFCPLGGTCSATVGEPIAQGETIFRNVASGTAITLFSTLGATVIAEE